MPPYRALVTRSGEDRGKPYFQKNASRLQPGEGRVHRDTVNRSNSGITPGVASTRPDHTRHPRPPFRLSGAGRNPGAGRGYPLIPNPLQSFRQKPGPTGAARLHPTHTNVILSEVEGSKPSFPATHTSSPTVVPAKARSKGHGGVCWLHPAADVRTAYLPLLEPPPKVSATLPSRRVNSIGKMNFVDGLSPMFLSVSRY